jgi:branched-chain amino acid transport system substrate-binding protein
MSQKNETAVLFLALLITVGLVGGGAWFLKENIWPQNSQEGGNSIQPNNKLITDRISFGEKILSAIEASPTKKEGITALASGNYSRAIPNLEAALKLNKNDPETLIFLNNARIGTAKNYTIVASVPLGTDPNGSLEILRGIAQAQHEINATGGIKGVPLKVGIANDDNNPEVAQQIANVLVKNQEVLGVVGPYASDVTLAAGTVYTRGQLVAISPISTSVKISNFSRYIFRTVPSDFMAARALAKYFLLEALLVQFGFYHQAIATPLYSWCKSSAKILLVLVLVLILCQFLHHVIKLIVTNCYK